jgi:hypothetical protein
VVRLKEFPLRQNDQVITRLRSAIADLKCSTVAEAEYEANPVAPSKPKVVEVVASSPPKAAEVTAPSPEPEAVFAAQRMLVEVRNASEALLRELSVLETRLNDEAQIVQATRDYAVAAKQAEGAAVVEQQAIEQAQAASTQCDAARTDAEAAKAQIEKLELLLRQQESHAQECVAAEDAAKCEAAEAVARVAACQAASAAAAKEAQVAQDRAEALKQALPQDVPSLAGISNVQTLATRIVEEAGALARNSRATQRDPLEDTAQLRW